MGNLLNKHKEIKNKKSGFTLVELLVVIAILAVLASVSVLGYFGFTTKARNINALIELAQAREVIRAELIDGDTYTYTLEDEKGSIGSCCDDGDVCTFETTSDSGIIYSISYKYDGNDYSFTFKYNVKHLNETLTYDTAIKASFSDIADLKGTLYVVTDPSALSFSDDTKTKTANAKIKTIGYATTAGGYALWLIDGDKIDTSTKEVVVLDENNLFNKTKQ